MPENKRPENIGAIWEKKTAKGGTFLSGSITINGLDYHWVAFKNHWKTGDKHPDYTIPPMRNDPTPARVRPAREATAEDAPPPATEPASEPKREAFPDNDLDANGGAGQTNEVPF
jgi:hypothetical protein